MLVTTKGTTITRHHGYKLQEYSCGDHEESIYYILRGLEVEELFYASPRKGHREAVKHFREFIDELQRA